MKGSFISIAALVAGAAAVPHAGHRHQHQHAKKDVEVDYVTDVAYVTAPGAVVYVDGNGNPVSTSYPSAASTSAPSVYSPAPVYSTVSSAASAASSVVSSVSSATSVYVPPTTTYAPSSYSAASSSTSTSAAPSSSESSSSGGQGITYSPYTSSGGCKTSADVMTDFETITGYDIVRIYGTDCNQVANVIAAASAKGMTVFAGIYDITQVEAEAKIICDAASSNWAVIDTVSVGNEGINSGTYTISEISAAVSSAKSYLSSAGYTGPVVTVDTFVAIIANPGLCEVGDYVAANCHAFFDGSVLAAGAGAFVLSQVQRVSAACGGKKTVITETGWPSSGSDNGVAVPSTSNQQAAISSIKSSFSSNVFLFTAFNDYWKQNNAGTYGAEQYWGIYGNSPSQ